MYSVYESYDDAWDRCEELRKDPYYSGRVYVSSRPVNKKGE